MRIALLLIVSLIWLPVASVRAAEGTDSVEAPNHAPVFFVTDRGQRARRSSLDFGAQINDPLDCITYGVIDLAATDASETGVSKANDPPGRSERTYPDFQQLAGDLHSAVDKSGQSCLIIFVHGCCISFREGVKQAKRLCQKVRAPVVLYDWGSPFASYSGSLLACPLSQERFNSFMMAVAHQFTNERIVVVGLSMGNILIDNFLLQHRPEEVGRIFDQVVFARADMDSIAFRSHLPKFAGHARRIFIYIDNRDPVINLSHFLRCLASPIVHGDRVGRLTTAFNGDQQVQVVDVSPLHLNHDLPSGVISDMLACDRSHPGAGQYRYVELSNGILQAQSR